MNGFFHNKNPRKDFEKKPLQQKNYAAPAEAALPEPVVEHRPLTKFEDDAITHQMNVSNRSPLSRDDYEYSMKIAGKNRGTAPARRAIKSYTEHLEQEANRRDPEFDSYFVSR